MRTLPDTNDPHSILIDKNGTIVFIGNPEKKKHSLEGDINKLINDETPEAESEVGYEYEIVEDGFAEVDASKINREIDEFQKLATKLAGEDDSQLKSYALRCPKAFCVSEFT